MNFLGTSLFQVNASCNGTMIGITEVDNQINDEKTIKVNSNADMYTYTAPNLAPGLNGHVVCFVNDALVL